MIIEKGNIVDVMRCDMDKIFIFIYKFIRVLKFFIVINFQEFNFFDIVCCDIVVEYVEGLDFDCINYVWDDNDFISFIGVLERYFVVRNGFLGRGGKYICLF